MAFCRPRALSGLGPRGSRRHGFSPRGGFRRRVTPRVRVRALQAFRLGSGACSRFGWGFCFVWAFPFFPASRQGVGIKFPGNSEIDRKEHVLFVNRIPFRSGFLDPRRIPPTEERKGVQLGFGRKTRKTQ